MFPCRHISAYILAGGKSSRMGEDKGLKLFKGKPLVLYMLEAVRPCVESIQIITANPDYGQFGYPALPDLLPHQGPMGGLYTALSHASTPQILLLSCDMPFISAEALQHLILRASEEHITVPSLKGSIQPLCAIYPTHLLWPAQHAVEQGRLKMMRFIEEHAHHTVNMDAWGERLFANMNTPEDLGSTY